MKKKLKRLKARKKPAGKKTAKNKKSPNVKKVSKAGKATIKRNSTKSKKAPASKKAAAPKRAAKKAGSLKRAVAKKQVSAPGRMPFLRRETDKNLLMDTELTALYAEMDTGNGHYRRRTDLGKCRNLSDSELVIVVQKENREAYKELFGRYQRKLFVYMYHLVGNREEVEDLLQNVFSKTYKHISHFDTDRKFSSWIYRIAHNEAVNFLKRKSKKQFISWEDIVTTKDKLGTQSEEKLPEEKWLLKELTEEVNQALDKLPEKYKQVLLMRYFSEYSYDAIAKMLGKPVNTIGTLINRAKKKMMDELEAVEAQNGKGGRKS